MTPLTRLVRNVAERFRGTYYEGPEPPPRLRDQVLTFVTAFPLANRKQWVEFAVMLAEQAYRTGYTRGLEWAERDLERRDPRVDPEELAKRDRGHAWSEGWGGDRPVENDPDNIPAEDGPEDPGDLMAEELKRRDQYQRERAGVGPRRR